MNYQQTLLTSDIDTLNGLIGIVIVIVLIGAMIRFALFIHDFSSELRYLNMEIERSEGAERRHYVRERRRLWLSLLPFVKY